VQLVWLDRAGKRLGAVGDPGLALGYWVTCNSSGGAPRVKKTRVDNA
jgi:hypothetical protein